MYLFCCQHKWKVDFYPLIFDTFELQRLDIAQISEISVNAKQNRRADNFIMYFRFSRKLVYV
jgi:hypothetical protein